MSIFRSYTYRWWQISLLKLSLLSFGVAAGAYWQKFFLSYLGLILWLAVMLGVYVAYLSFTQSH